MSLDCVRKANECARSNPCVAGLLTETQVTVRVRSWAGRVGAGAHEDSDLVLPMSYPVEEVKSYEVASSAGRFEIGDLRVSDITKPFGSGLTAGGYTEEQLHPQILFGVNDEHLEELYVLTGAHKGIFALVNLERDDMVAWSMVLRRTRRAA